MNPAHVNYLPLPAPFFLLIVLILIAVVGSIIGGVLRYVYARLGISAPAAVFILLCSLFGSYWNIPVAQLPPERVMSGETVMFFGMQYRIPVVQDWPGTVIAVNVGGALIPVALSLYLLVRNRIWGRALVAVACVTLICHLLAQPVPGVGIAIPVFVPPLVAAAVALALSRTYAAVLAYVGGSIGTLIGADLLNLGKVRGLGAPVASIGGAGTFDGIFLTGIIAVLLASIPTWFDRPAPMRRSPWG